MIPPWRVFEHSPTNNLATCEGPFGTGPMDGDFKGATMNSQREISRRMLLLAGLAGSAAPLLSTMRSFSKTPSSELGIPGPFPGRVIAVRHPGSIVLGAFQAEPIRAMMHRGMAELTGTSDWAES